MSFEEQLEDSAVVAQFRSRLSGVRARLQRTASTQPINSTAITAVSWDSAITEDGGDFWDISAPTKIVIPIAGFYLITAGVLFNNAGGDHDLFLADFANAGARYDEGNAPAGGGATYQKLATMVQFPAGFALSVYAFQNSGAASTLGGGGAHQAHVELVKL